MEAIKESHEGYKGDNNFIITSSGIKFSLAKPVILLSDVAHALAATPRFGGHTKFPYSVAQHSLMVMDIVGYLLGYPMAKNNKLFLEALLHDATEAYLTDVPSPFKQFLPEWRAIDARLDAVVRETFGLPAEKSEIVKKADWYALFIEAAHLLPEGSVLTFEDPHGYREPALQLAEETRLDYDLLPMDYERDRTEFKWVADNLLMKIAREEATSDLS